MPSIQITTSTFGEVSKDALALLDDAGIGYRLNPHRRRLDPAETRALLAGRDGVIAGTESLDRSILEGLPDLRIISRCGTGLENVDLEAAADLGVEVRNTPDAVTDAVAELTLGGMLATLRSIARADHDIRAGTWQKPMGRLLRGKTVGIIGLGRIGRALARLLQPFEVRILAHDIDPDTAFAESRGIELCDIDELLPRADIVTLHLPHDRDAAPILDRARLEAMREHAVLVNCSRGGLVDESALYRLLVDERLAGAYLDTFSHEPYSGPLKELSSVLLTPHIGSYAAESRLRMELEAVRNLIDFFTRKDAV